LSPVVPRAGRQQAAVWTYPLAAVEATGLKRIPLSEVQKLAGLRAGRTVGPNDIEAARQRLVASGLFTSVGYNFRTAGYRLVVIFQVTERPWDTRVVFDNFPGYTDAQLVIAVRRDLPAFDGMTADHDAVLKRIAGALERVARESNDPGRVSYAVIFDEPEGVRHYRFHLDRFSGPLPICAVDLPGLGAAFQASLAEKARSLLDIDYSKEFVTNHARENFIPILVAQGLTRATVTGVTARRDPARTGCERGVVVSVSIGSGRLLLRGSVERRSEQPDAFGDARPGNGEPIVGQDPHAAGPNGRQ
jgi:outer membrane translocation and assembly module TamA